MSRVPPRLHVIPATGCSKALILRRGPNAHVASLLWDRATGEIEMGQWLKGRIYEHRADLSPDGRHMIYFAGTGQRWWTALSRAPWLRAIAFYPKGDTWHGGGAFDPKGRVWLNGTLPPDAPLPDGLKPADVAAFPHATDGFHMGNMYGALMALRGWHNVEGTRYDTVLMKKAQMGWHLELRIALNAKDRALISNKFALVHLESGARREQPDWEWADVWEGGLQLAARGAVHAARLSEQGDVEDVRTLHDFSDMTFEPIEAPYEGVRQ